MKKVVLDDETLKAIKPTTSPSNSSQQPPNPSPPPPAVDEREDVAAGPPQLLSQELMGILMPSLKVGTVGGLCGLFTGATAGIITTSTPVLFSLHTGWQWFALSSSFWGSRQYSLRLLRGDEEIRSSDKIKASAIGGGFAGTIGGLIRGPKNILPGAVMFALFGAGGQVMVNAYHRRRETNEGKKSGGGFLASKWSPVTPLSDQEYEAMLEEKLLRVEAELAIIDDHIKAVRDEEATAKTNKPSSEQDSPKPP